jgi:hypothetical protein
VSLDNAGNSFEQGAVDTFTLRLRDLTRSSRCGSGTTIVPSFPGWYLGRIFNCNEDSDPEVGLRCNRWLAQDENDGEIERVLDPT